QPIHALAGSNGKVQIANRLIQYRLLLGAERLLRPVSSLSLGAFFQRLAQVKPLRSHHLLDFQERCFAEVLAAKQVLFGDARQVAERANVHFLQAISTANGKLEIGDRNLQDLTESAEGMI